MLPDCVVTVCVGATVDRKVKQTLMRMRDEIVHENVARFFGISSHADDAAVCLVEQNCANGTLVEFLRDNEHIVDHPFRYVVCADVASGMAYLHRHDLTHGNLSAPTSPAEWRTSTATTSLTEPLCADVASGMAYLHRHDLVHGNLSTDKCHVDARWTVKVVDWEYCTRHSSETFSRAVLAKRSCSGTDSCCVVVED